MNVFTDIRIDYAKIVSELKVFTRQAHVHMPEKTP
jgi:hypothetical protein